MSRLAALISMVIVAIVVSIGTAANSITWLAMVTVLIAVAVLAHHGVVRQPATGVRGAPVPSWRKFLGCVMANTFRFGVAAVSIAWVVVLVRMFTAA
jgi:hypothetical protein